MTFSVQRHSTGVITALTPLIGQWRGTETLLPGPGRSEAQARLGILWFRPTLEGKAFQVDYQQLDRGITTLRGTGLMEVHRLLLEREVVLHWWDTEHPGHLRLVGQLDGDTLHFADTAGSGMAVTFRFDLPLRIDLTREGRASGGPIEPRLQATYTFHGK